jgi:hypothetical protein
MSLTGRIRYRVGRSGFRRVLILQVEESSRDSSFYGAFVEYNNVLKWRDATVEDLSEQADGLKEEVKPNG